MKKKFISQIHEVAKMQQLAGLKESYGFFGMRSLQEGDETQELFNSWVQDQADYDNIIDAEYPEELRGNDKVAWDKFLETITKFPNANKEDVAVAVSTVYFADMPFDSLSWNDEDSAKEVYNYLREDEE